MNWSLYTADQSTHLKTFVVGLSSALLLSAMGIVAIKINRDIDTTTAQALTVIKVGAPVMFTEGEGPVAR